eukprot:GHVU01011669.1.p1 GENE.GHVU01011669.1~~GHVU01011669.1.p1  ORF type:complete len:136 (+),score=4.97 GHVU01011669.1:373-780(+)
MCSTRVTLWCRCCVYPSRPHPCCYSFAHIALEKREVGYYLLSGPNFGYYVLNEMIPNRFSWRALKNKIFKDNPHLRETTAALEIRFDDNWTDILSLGEEKHPQIFVFNIIAITKTGYKSCSQHRWEYRRGYILSA